MGVEHVEVDSLQTVFSVWQGILETRPEVVKQTVKSYANHPHGTSDDQRIEVLPIERIKGATTKENFLVTTLM